MYYFVIGTDGQSYGPADVDTLVAWVGEGRIVESTELIERGTDRRLMASSLPAIAAVLRRATTPASPVTVERGFDQTQTAPGIPAAKVVPHSPPHSPPFPPAPMHPPHAPPVPGFVPLQYAGGFGRPRKSKLAAGLLGIFLGGFGIHRFYLGYVGIGCVQLLLTVLTCGYGAIITHPWGMIEGIVCLCGGMRDANGMELTD